MFNFEKVIFALNSDTRLRIIDILNENESCGVIDILEDYVRLYGQIRRETIYREVEKLVKAGIVDKRYSQKEKRIYYELRFRRFNADIINRRIFIGKNKKMEISND